MGNFLEAIISAISDELNLTHKQQSKKKVLLVTKQGQSINQHRKKHVSKKHQSTHHLHEGEQEPTPNIVRKQSMEKATEPVKKQNNMAKQKRLQKAYVYSEIFGKPKGL